MMQPKIIDISLPVKDGMTIWPKTTGIEIEQVESLKKGDLSNTTQFKMGSHVGTHLDAPLHFIPDGSTLDKIPLEKLIGPAVVVYLPEVKAVTAGDLASFNLPENVRRLLLKTSNSELWQKEEKFREDYVGLTPDAASWLVEHNIELVGIDYLSVAQYSELTKVHQTLLKNGVVVLEGLNLFDVSPGSYHLICLPIRLIGTEGAPVRAVLLSS